MFLEKINNFEGYLATLDNIMCEYAYYSEEDFIYSNRNYFTEYDNITYTDIRNDNNHVIIEFNILDNDPEYADIWVKVTDYYED